MFTYLRCYRLSRAISSIAFQSGLFSTDKTYSVQRLDIKAILVSKLPPTLNSMILVYCENIGSALSLFDVKSIYFKLLHSSMPFTSTILLFFTNSLNNIVHSEMESSCRSLSLRLISVKCDILGRCIDFRLLMLKLSLTIWGRLTTIWASVRPQFWIVSSYNYGRRMLSLTLLRLIRFSTIFVSF